MTTQAQMLSQQVTEGMAELDAATGADGAGKHSTVTFDPPEGEYSHSTPHGPWEDIVLSADDESVIAERARITRKQTKIEWIELMTDGARTTIGDEVLVTIDGKPQTYSKDGSPYIPFDADTEQIDPSTVTTLVVTRSEVVRFTEAVFLPGSNWGEDGNSDQATETVRGKLSKARADTIDLYYQQELDGLELAIAEAQGLNARALDHVSDDTVRQELGAAIDEASDAQRQYRPENGTHDLLGAMGALHDASVSLETASESVTAAATGLPTTPRWTAADWEPFMAPLQGEGTTGCEEAWSRYMVGQPSNESAALFSGHRYGSYKYEVVDAEFEVVKVIWYRCTN